MTLESKEIRFRKAEFVAKTQFLYAKSLIHLEAPEKFDFFLNSVSEIGAVIENM